MVSNQKEHRDHTLAVWKVLPGANYGNALRGDLQTRRDRRDYLYLLLDVTPSLEGAAEGGPSAFHKLGNFLKTASRLSAVHPFETGIQNPKGPIFIALSPLTPISFPCDRKWPRNTGLQGTRLTDESANSARR
jgi:hypothetical protein